MKRSLTSLASLAGVAAFTLAAQQEVDAQCQNQEGFPVLHEVTSPGDHVRLLSEDLRNQYNLDIRGLVLNPECTGDNKMGLLVANLDRLTNPNTPESEYNRPYLFTNCNNGIGLNNVTTPEQGGQPRLEQQCFYDGQDYCSGRVLLDTWTNETGTRRNFTVMEFEHEEYRYASGTFGIRIPEEITPIAIVTNETYEDFGNGQIVLYQGAAFSRNGRAMLRYELNGESRTTTNQMTSGYLATQPFEAIEYKRSGGGAYLMGLHNTFLTPHVISIELDLTTNTFQVCGNIVVPVVDTDGNSVDTVNHKIITRDINDIYENTHTVGFVLNPDEENPNGFKLFATVNLNTCNFTGCAPEETCRENTGICEPTEVNIDPCEGVVCGPSEVCIEGTCTPDEEADAGVDTGDTGLDTDMGEDANDATDDADLEEVDMADELDAQPDMPEEDVANSDTGDADVDAEDTYNPSNNGNPDTGVCVLAATECKPGEEMVNNGDQCACAPIDTPDPNPDTGTDSGNNEQQPPALEPKEEGCATAPGEIQGNTKGLLLAALTYALRRRKKAA